MNLIGRVVVCCEFDREGGCFDRDGVVCCEFDREGGCLL